MLRANRIGMALITVVLISALVFASIVGIAVSVVSENKMIASRSASQRALTAAESGLSQVLFNLRNVDFAHGTTIPTGVDSTFAYLTFTDVKTIAQTSAPTTFPVYNSVPVPGGGGTPYVTYQVKIRKTWGVSNAAPADLPDMELSIYSLGTVYTNVQKTTVLARTAIAVNVSITHATPNNIRAAMLGGSTIKFNGITNKVVHGDIWTGGEIKDQSAKVSDPTLQDGTAYATLSIDEGIAATRITPTNSPIGQIDILRHGLEEAYSQKMATAFYSGAAPYDGSDSSYPNTSRVNRTDLGLTTTDAETIKTIFTHYLGAGNGTASFASIASFFPALKAPTTDSIYNPNAPESFTPGVQGFLVSLEAFAQSSDPVKAAKIECYYNNGVGRQELQNANYNLGGTLVIGGDFTMNGGQVNCQLPVTDPPVGVNPLVLRVMGTVDLKGNGALVANIVASGAVSLGGGNPNEMFKLSGYVVTPRTITLGGGTSVWGSLVTSLTMTVSGTNDIRYVETGLGSIPGPPTATVGAVESSWEEVSFDKFSNP